MAKRFVMGDIHGAHRALHQCLERSGFNRQQDWLYCLGDVCDGWPDTRECIETLMGIRHLVYVMGNHDFHTLEWALHGIADESWLEQGGLATQQSYHFQMPEPHVSFLKNAKPYFTEDNQLFVHAGIWPGKQPEQCGLNILLWDRTLVTRALDLVNSRSDNKLTSFSQVYIGHTPIGPRPLKGGEVWMMDTGAGWSGVLSMMNLDSGEVFASDPVPLLYPGVEGRKKR